MSSNLPTEAMDTAMQKLRLSVQPGLAPLYGFTPAEAAALLARLSDEPSTKHPPLGLLVSMAIRMDHGLAIPGYYDSTMFGDAPVHERHARMFQAAVNNMRQLWEETAGTGFYSPERDAEYVAKYEAATACLATTKAGGTSG